MNNHGSMMTRLKENWTTYLMELFGLAGFVLIAGMLTIFLEHPDLPVMKGVLKDYPLLRRIPLGLMLGAYIGLLILWFGKKSGAHINPAATWTFYRLGKINFFDAAFFTLAQFMGAVGAAQLLKLIMGDLFSHPLINYGVTKPAPPHGIFTAFVAEGIISFILMLLILMASSSKRFEKKVALLSGLLIAVYLIFEIPLSGMSLNPARSFAGALAANEWKQLWVYFIAPPLAMLAASEVFIYWKKGRQQKNSLVVYPGTTNLAKNDYKEIPHYPVSEEHQTA